jgi:hypothetical protein
LNHYVRYSQNADHSEYIGRILGYNMPYQRFRAHDEIKCPYPNCNAEYSYWSIRKKMMPAFHRDFKLDYITVK